MHPIWEGIKIDSEDVVKLALGCKELPDVGFTPWETILTEIIAGDAFGVDRMDYLLRDSHHAGVAYGKFDQYRLIDTLHILPQVSTDVEEDARIGFALGVDEGGIQSAEALMLARYFMYSQIYFHPIRRIYDIHLQEFILEWLDDDGYPTDVEGHLRRTDAEVMAALRKAERDKTLPGHRHACRIDQRRHFKLIYSRNPDDAAIDTEAGETVFQALSEEFGADHFRHDRYRQKGNAPEFPVRMRDGRVSLSSTISIVLTHLPVVDLDSVFADRKIVGKAERWLKNHRNEILRSRPEEDTDMDRRRKNAVLTRFVQVLRDRGSWAGETHIQKAAYFLQELLGVPLGFRFILYWYGPFSFDLRDELTGLRGDGLLRLQTRRPYGFRYEPTDLAEYVQKSFPKTLAKYHRQIDFIADQIGTKNVKELERLATGYYVTRKLPDGTIEERADELMEIKPHVDLSGAVAVVREVDEIIDQAQALVH